MTTETLRVFISYARSDAAAFADELLAGLEVAGFEAFLDRHDIAAGEDWEARLGALIHSADTVVFVVTPAAVASERCAWEVKKAELIAKRIIPVVAIDVPESETPEGLKRLNYIYFTQGRSYSRSLAELANALRVDLAWIREHTRLAEIARRWRERDQSEVLLLRGPELSAARQWLASWKDGAPEPTDLHRALISASELAENTLVERERDRIRRQGRLQRFVAYATMAALLATLLGAWLVIDGRRALGRAQSLMLANASFGLFEQGDSTRGWRLALLATRDSFLSPAAPEARVALASNTAAMRLEAEFRPAGVGLTGAKLSPDERQLVTWDRNGLVTVWNVRTGEVIRSLQQDGVENAEFDPRGERVLVFSGLTRSDRSRVRVWRLSSGTALDIPLRSVRDLYGARFVDGGAKIVVWGWGASVLDAQTGRNLATLRPQTVQTVVSVSPDGRTLSVVATHGGPADEGVQLWDCVTGARVPVAVGALKGFVGFSPDSKYALASAAAGVVVIEAASGAAIGTITQDQVTGAVFADSQRVYLWGYKDQERQESFFREWDLQTHKPSKAIDRHYGAIEDARCFGGSCRALINFSKGPRRVGMIGLSGDLPSSEDILYEGDQVNARYSSDGKYVLVYNADFYLGDAAGGDASARVIDAETGLQVGARLRHDARINGAVFDKSGARILTWSEDGAARLWRTAARGLLYRLQDTRFADGSGASGIRGAIASKDGTRILVWEGASLFGHGSGFSVWLVNAKTGEPLGGPMRHQEEVTSASFSGDEKRILTWGQDYTARVWSAETGTAITPPLRHGRGNHSGDAGGAVFSPDGARVLSWGPDQVARQWSASTGAKLGPVLAHADLGSSWSGARYSDDGDLIATWSDPERGRASVRLWRAATGEQIGGDLWHNAPVRGVVFSADDQVVASWGEDRSARLWRTKDGAALTAPLMHGGAVSGAVFTTNGKQLLTWSKDGTARLWNVATGKQIGASMSHTGPIVGASFNRDESRILTWGYDAGEVGAVRIWSAKSQQQIGRALRHPGVVAGATYNEGESRILAFGSECGYCPYGGPGGARIWDVKTGLQIGPTLNHRVGVGVAGFNDGETRVFALESGGFLSSAGTLNAWDVSWSTRPDDLQRLRHESCAKGPRSGSKTSGEKVSRLRWPWSSPIRSRSTGVRSIDAKDVEIAPILRGREGEDVCAR